MKKRIETHEKHDEIYSMFKKGRPFKEIDEKLGLPINFSRTYLHIKKLFEYAEKPSNNIRTERADTTAYKKRNKNG